MMTDEARVEFFREKKNKLPFLYFGQKWQIVGLSQLTNNTRQNKADLCPKML